MFASAKKLRAAGVVGMNARNSRYVMPLNPRSLYTLVDDKMRTKQLALSAGIAVPELYALINSIHDARDFETLLHGHNSFVVKPAHGSSGQGILVITGRRHNTFFKADGGVIDIHALRHHIENILSGIYSLGGQVDQAIIEYRVKFDPVFNAVSYQGVPDIRILVYRGVPAMAMLRLPTKRSHGKANLHQGAVGAGISMQTGVTTQAVCNNQYVSEHPDFAEPLKGIQIPGWQDLLLLATQCYELAPLGYLGVDIVLDADLGPLILEMNARPGLAIQIANGKGLQKRLDAIDAHQKQFSGTLSADARAALIQSLDL
jgi:alpha-L-glutamate ligase-like protein